MEAQYVAQENARKFKESYPLAAETVLKSTYMDDSIDSAEDVMTAKALQTELQELWAKAGMEARKWVSNSKQVLAAIPEEHRASELLIQDTDQPMSKTLGLSWFSEEDTLSVPASPRSTTRPITKRNVLKKIATVFDPLGLISPVVIRGKQLLQTLWGRGYDWDDEILDDVANEIQSWFDQLLAIAQVKVPRCIRLPVRVASFKLVTFVDASTRAFGAAIYARFEYEPPHPPTCRLLASKSKVAPLVPVTVPRLELMAAVTGLRLSQAIIRVLEIPMSAVKFYSDSLDVLWWIRGHGKDFHAFVANRVGEIQMHSDPQQWQHVSTEQNPADLVSRGVNAKDIIDNSLWWNGPDWLLKSEDDWPKIYCDNPPRGMKESKKPTVLLSHHATSPSDSTKNAEAEEWRLNPKRYSSWMRLICIRARVVRVLCKMQKKESPGRGVALHPEEIQDTEEDIIRQVQREVFSEEYQALKNNKAISSKSQLTKLSPRIDDDGVIRMEGRLQYADSLTYDARYPIILPRGHYVTKLIVKHYHEKANHAGGVNFILAQLSQRFWIIAAREEIRRWENECNECKKRRTKLATQIMAPLPKVRLRFTFRPFDQTAVDYAGPFITIQGRGRQRQKRWLCLFTCLATRAIHLEMAWALDTESFLNAFTRFTSRRGVPSEVTSDNGTNFVGAINELSELVSKIDPDRVQQKTTHLFNKVKWHFNPPAAPHFGGAHEAMIKSAKRAVYAVLGNGDIRDEELITALAGVESLINSRPLTYHTSDPKDATPLTPNHFLHGQIGGQGARNRSTIQAVTCETVGEECNNY